jgi:RNA polymerase sigma-70 factor (ECF subfamily)
MPEPGPQAQPDRGAATGRTTSLTLIEQVKAHDQDAWTRLVYLYTPLVAHWCRRWGVSGADVDDVIQEVFQAVAVGLESFRRASQTDTFRGWLRGVTRHKVLDRFRRPAPRGQGGTEFYNQLLAIPEIDPDQGDPESERAEATAMGDVFRRALEIVRGEFEARTWDLFWRAAVDGAPPNEVATLFGVSPGAVRQAKSRVLRRLKLVLGEASDPTERA